MIKALAFDVFGTVLDWRGTIIAEGNKIDPSINWSEFAEEWMHQYGKKVSELESWERLDDLLQDGFFELADSKGMNTEDYCDFSWIWSALQPWPDSVRGFASLKDKFILAALTNANIPMLNSLAETLPWDILLSGELVHKYKPAPEIYKLALNSFNLTASEILMVASHTFDLNAANKHGFKTALIERASEPGSNRKDLDHVADYIVSDIEQLAKGLNDSQELYSM